MNGLMAIKQYAAGGITFPDGFTSLSGPYKAEYYNNLRKDYSESEILKAAEKQFGTIPADQWNMLTSYADTVKTLERVYQDLFNRPLDPEGRDYWTQVTEGRPASEIYQLVANAAQAEDRAKLDPDEAAKASVKSIFAEQLGRQPTAAELTQYVAFINDGRSTADISRELDRSLEGYNFDAEKIEADYRNLFGRTADQEGFQYWMSTEDASAGKVSANKLNSYIEGGAKGTDVAALADRPEAGYGVETPISLSSLIADPYGGRYATDLPYLSQAETDALFPGSGSEGSAYAAAEGQIGLPQYYMNIRNWFRDNPNATSAQVNAEAQKWGVSDADIRAALNPEIGLVSKTLAGELIKFTTPVTEQPVQSWFDAKGEFSAQAGPNVLQREDVDAAINRALASGAINQTQVNQLNQDISNADTWAEVYEALNKPKANVVLNELGVQVGEDVDANEALQEANARKELADAASNLIGGGYPSAVLQGQLAPGMKIDYPFSAEKMRAGYEGTTTKKGLADIAQNLGTELRLSDAAYTAPYSAVPYIQAAYPSVDVQPVGGVQAANQALLSRSGKYPGLLTDVYRPQLRPDIRTPDGKLISARPAAGVGELISLESKTRYGLPSTQESRGAQAMQPIAPYLGPSFAPPTNVNQTGLTPPGYVIDPRTGQVIFPYSTSPTGGTVNAGTAGSAVNAGTVGGVNSLPGVGIPGVTFTNTPDMGAGTPMPMPITETNLVGGQGTPSITVVPIGGSFVKAAGAGLDSTFPASPSRSEGALGAIIGEQAPAEIVNQDFPTPMPGVPGDDEGSEDPVDVIGSYAGGPVMGSPQYFEEGGEVEPMRKYTPTELGSTFDVSEYIDPDTGRFMINEYRRDVVFNPELERAEQAAMAVTLPPNWNQFTAQEKIDWYNRNNISARQMQNYGVSNKDINWMLSQGYKDPSLRDQMIRQGRTGREYELPGITVGGPATSGIRPLNYYAKGGLTDIARKGYAEELRQQGRNGDTILAHINPTEAKMLEAMGGSGTINPRTGLPEYGFSWKKLFRLASKVVPFVLPGPAGAVAAGVLAGASTPGKTFDFKRGLQTGIMTYAGGKLGEKVGAEFGSTASSSLPGNAAFQAEVGLSAPPTLGQQITSALPDVSRFVPEGVTINPTTLGQAYGATVSDAAAEEAIKIEKEQQAFFDEEERRRKNFAQVFQEGAGNIQPLVYARRGGLMALAGGGAIDPVGYEGGGMTAPVNQPRMLAGGGDGMSDSIPATIDGTQPARLADGEFVIPADVVADIGNGSSSAGAKRLYGMMDRVREARHGTTKQPPEIKMNRLMPA